MIGTDAGLYTIVFSRYETYNNNLLHKSLIHNVTAINTLEGALVEEVKKEPLYQIFMTSIGSLEFIFPIVLQYTGTYKVMLERVRYHRFSVDGGDLKHVQLNTIQLSALMWKGLQEGDEQKEPRKAFHEKLVEYGATDSADSLYNHLTKQGKSKYVQTERCTYWWTAYEEAL